MAEVAVAVEETGRVLLPAPYLSTALAGAVLSEGTADGGAAEFLPGIASGALRAAFALGGSVTASGDRLTGIAHNVLDGTEAGLSLVRAGDALFAVRAADAVVTPAGHPGPEQVTGHGVVPRRSGTCGRLRRRAGGGPAARHAGGRVGRRGRALP